jgi:hypothetical protein
MKQHKFFTAVILIALGFSGTSCKKYLDSAFANPNKPTVVDPDQVWPSIINIMSRGIQFDSRFSGRYVQYWAATTTGESGAGINWERHGYTPPSVSTSAADGGGDIWRSHYYGFGANLLNVIRDGRNSGRPAYAGAGYAVFAWSWLLLTDYHGEVILKEAFKADQLTFHYDTQPEVYDYVKLLTDSALYYLNQAKNLPATSFVAGDQLMYGGDISKWIKFTYAVKAMVYHRYLLKGNYNADSVIDNVDRSFASSADDALVKFPGLSFTTASLNFYGPTRQNMGTYRPTDYVINLLNGSIMGTPDPRLKYIFKPAQDSVYRGLVIASLGSGLSATQLPPNFYGLYSNNYPTQDTGKTYFKNNAPFPILTYSEMQFIKAEAAYKKGDQATALQAYTNGLNGSFDQLTQNFTGYRPISASDRVAFLADPNIVPAAGSLTLSQIMLQKYISLWPWNPNETWVDLRKYQYSASVYTNFTLPSPFYPDNLGKTAQRARPRYNSEYLWNRDELQRIGALDIDYHTKPVWFSQQ